MSNTKIVFIGNILAGDDGIGPYLYSELKDAPELKSFELLEAGVIGLDLLPYVEDTENLIIVDAIYSDDNFGEVIVLSENELSKQRDIVSQHDFDVDKTVEVLRMCRPEMNPVKIVAVRIRTLPQSELASTELSEELMGKMPQIKKDVIENILQITKNA